MADEFDWMAEERRAEMGNKKSQRRVEARHGARYYERKPKDWELSEAQMGRLRVQCDFDKDMSLDNFERALYAVRELRQNFLGRPNNLIRLWGKMWTFNEALCEVLKNFPQEEFC